MKTQTEKKSTTMVEEELKNFMTSLILENKELITEKFRELDPYKMMSIVAKILPYISSKETSKKTKKTQKATDECHADEASVLPGLESDNNDEGCIDEEATSDDFLDEEASVFPGLESENNDGGDKCYLPRRKKEKRKKKKKKRKR